MTELEVEILVLNRTKYLGVIYADTFFKILNIFLATPSNKSNI